MYITDDNNINNNDDDDDDLLICYSAFWHKKWSKVLYIVYILVLKIYKMNLW